VSLTLTNKFDVPGDEDAEMDARTILLNTKRLIVDVIRFQPGETLTEILETPATSEQVELNRGHRCSRDWCVPGLRGWDPDARRCFPAGGPEHSDPIHELLDDLGEVLVRACWEGCWLLPQEADALRAEGSWHIMCGLCVCVN